MDNLPEWHEVSDRYDHDDVINLKAIAELDDAPGYDALRSYATGRREHALLGPMPDPVCRIVNRRLWLKADIAAWLHCPIPAWRRTKQAIARWIESGRPRAVPAPEAPRPRPTMPSDHGPGPTTP